MKLFVKNTLAGLVPLYSSDLDEKNKLKLGAEYEAEIKHPRNIGFHRKFMALVNIGHQNTLLDMPFETYRRYVTMKAGYFKTYTTDKGTYYEAESISFSSMDQAQFEEVYERVLQVIIKDINVTPEEISEVLINFM